MTAFAPCTSSSRLRDCDPDSRGGTCERIHRDSRPLASGLRWLSLRLPSCVATRVGLKADPRRADADDMRTPPLLRSLLAAFVLTGVLATTPALAGRPWGPKTADARCYIEFHRRKSHYIPPRAEFIVRSPGHRGAVGVWEQRSGDRLRVSVEPGEGEASKWRSRVSRREYELVRCQTV
jgi:hypothetical protein